jgi:uncharacterized protein
MMHAASAAAFDRSLGALAALLLKAEAQAEARKIKPEAILNFRLFPDMFPFVRQVQLACDFACRGTARLAGEAPQPFPDTETTWADLQARIAAARAYIASFPADRLDAAAGSTVTFPMQGRDQTMPAPDYLIHFVLPQVYFHLTTAYNILRHCGFDIGKRDFMGIA